MAKRYEGLLEQEVRILRELLPLGEEKDMVSIFQGLRDPPSPPTVWRRLTCMVERGFVQTRTDNSTLPDGPGRPRVLFTLDKTTGLPALRKALAALSKDVSDEYRAVGQAIDLAQMSTE